MKFKISVHAVQRAYARIPGYHGLPFREVCDKLNQKLKEAHALALFFDNPDPHRPGQYVAYFQENGEEFFAIINADEPFVPTVFEAVPTLHRSDKGDVDYSEILQLGRATYACVENQWYAA